MPDVPQCRKYLLWNCLASLRQKQNIAAILVRYLYIKVSCEI